jgi:uncharacterized protein YkuJ
VPEDLTRIRYIKFIKEGEKVLKVLYNKANKGFQAVKRRTPNG